MRGYAIRDEVTNEWLSGFNPDCLNDSPFVSDEWGCHISFTNGVITNVVGTPALLDSFHEATLLLRELNRKYTNMGISTRTFRIAFVGEQTTHTIHWT